ncbi:MAG: threonylcarbamoyl-AMP synthase [Patescibacteria group bacterium]|nr:threonylcarbamoyl-AMP synthase [Patescibacteria group bacterium]
MSPLLLKKNTAANRIVAAKILNGGGVGVMPTDTIYGVLGGALLPKTVERIYRLRRRNKSKPLIVLISSPRDLKTFKIKLSALAKRVLKQSWPGKVSVILPCPSAAFRYLHRGKKTLAFRLPKYRPLIKLLKLTGPLVAPSANWEGYPPANNVAEARKYFRGRVDFYLSGGSRKSKPSRLIKIENNRILALRK